MTDKIDKVLEHFDADLARQDKSDLTRRGYLADLRDYAHWVEQTYGETFNPREITHDDVRAYLSHLTTVRKAKPSTINRRHAALSTFCRWAVQAKLLKADPTTDIKAAKQAKTPPKALVRSDLNRLLRKVNQSGNALHAAVLVTLANTGLRVGELVALTLSDVEIRPRSGKVTVRNGKGNKYREVPLNADARRAIGEYVRVRPNPAQAEHADRVFLGQRGEPLTPSGAWRMIDKYAKQAGLEEVSPHVLRHTFATHLLREHGADLVTVADLLGHENVGTTMRYTQSTEADRRAAVEKLSSIAAE
jgi:site-specific recombinase XerD